MRLLSGSIGLVICALLIGACGTTRTLDPGNTPTGAPRLEATERYAHVLHAAAEEWDGTPHQWGGTSEDGVDCSGLVQTIYRDSLDQSLPRTTAEQSQIGASVSPDDLQPGDLVFFRVDTRTGRHVGMYLSNGDFLHASSQGGVSVSSLQAPYWQTRWWQARRVLPQPQSAGAEPSTAAGATVGW
ncbi:MAG: NlpC/P60 family protein [Salinibacter sp.]